MLDQLEIATSFGYKCAWLAIQSGDPQAVADALGLLKRELSGWGNGIKRAYDREGGYTGAVFVTPVIDGWVLCVATSMFAWIEPQHGSLGDRLVKLSRTLNAEVQFFATHRVVEAHDWAKAVKGTLVRHFGYVGESGEVLADHGEPTDEEKRLGLLFPDGWQEKELPRFPDEEDVLAMARAWGIDPAGFDVRQLQVPAGILGKLPEFDAARANKPKAQESMSLWQNAMAWIRGKG